MKGKAPEGEFRFGGYNNLDWPLEGIIQESMIQGQQVLLFLHPTAVFRGTEPVIRIQENEEGEQTDVEVPTLADIDFNKVLRNPKEYARLHRDMRMRGRRQFVGMLSTPTPTTGDLRVQGPRVNGMWSQTSCPNFGAGAKLSVVLPLVRGLVAHQAKKAPTEALAVLKEKLNPQLIQSISVPEEGRSLTRKQIEMICTVEWLLCAQAAYGGADKIESIRAATQHDLPFIRSLGARALRSLPETEASLKIAKELLEQENPSVQIVTAQSLMNGSFTKRGVAEMLTAALVASKPDDKEERSVMDPIQNTSASSQATLVWACTHFGITNEIEKTLLDLLSRDTIDPRLLSALSAHFLAYPNDTAEKLFARSAKKTPAYGEASVLALHLFHEKSESSIVALRNMIRNPKLHVHDRAQWLKRYSRELGADHPAVVKLVDTLLEEEKDDHFEALLLGCVLARKVPPAPDWLRDYIQKQKLNPQEAREGVWLMLVNNGPTNPVEELFLQSLQADPGLLAGAVLCPTDRVIAEVRKLAQQEDTLSPEMTALIPIVEKALHLKHANKKPSIDTCNAWLQLLAWDEENGRRGIAFPAILGLAGSIRPEYADEAVRAIRSFLSKNPRRLSWYGYETLMIVKRVGGELTEAEKEVFAGNTEVDEKYYMGDAPWPKWEVMLKSQLKGAH